MFLKTQTIIHKFIDSFSKKIVYIIINTCDGCSWLCINGIAYMRTIIPIQFLVSFTVKQIGAGSSRPPSYCIYSLVLPGSAVASFSPFLSHYLQQKKSPQQLTAADASVRYRFTILRKINCIPSISPLFLRYT